MKPSHSKNEGIRFLPQRNLWQARIKVAGKAQSKSFSSLDEAVCWRQKLLSTRTQGEALSEPSKPDYGPLCGELFEDWLQDPLAFKSPETRRKARGNTKVHLVPALGEQRVREVASAFLMDFLTQMLRSPRSYGGEKLRSPKTVKNVLGSVSGFFEWCALKGFVEDNPARDHKFREKLRRYLKSSRPREYLAESIEKKARTPDEMKRLISIAERSSPEDAIAIELLLHTGLRLGEAAALVWENVVWVDSMGNPLPRPLLRINKTMCFQTKEVKQGAKWGSNGFVELNSRACRALERWKQLCVGYGYSSEQGAFFLPQIARSPSAFSQRVTRYGESAGIRHVSPHSLRHTSITFQVVGGATMQEVQKVARHSSSNMTAAYFDATQLPVHGVTEKVVEVMEGRMQKGPPPPPPFLAQRGRLALVR